MHDYRRRNGSRARTAIFMLCTFLSDFVFMIFTKFYPLSNRSWSPEFCWPLLRSEFQSRQILSQCFMWILKTPASDIWLHQSINKIPNPNANDTRNDFHKFSTRVQIRFHNNGIGIQTMTYNAKETSIILLFRSFPYSIVFIDGAEITTLSYELRIHRYDPIALKLPVRNLLSLYVIMTTFPPPFIHSNYTFFQLKFEQRLNERTVQSAETEWIVIFVSES